MLGGALRVTLFGSHGRWREETLARGDVGYIPQGFGHSIENIGADKARILIVFNSGHYQTINLSQWIAGNSTDVLATNFGQDAALFSSSRREMCSSRNSDATASSLGACFSVLLRALSSV